MSGLSSSEKMDFYKLTVENQTTPVIIRLKKTGGEWKEAERGDKFTGILKKFELGGYDYTKGKVKNYQHTIALHFDVDGNDAKLEMNLNGIAKNIINSFSNVTNLPGSKVELRVYEKNDNPNIYLEVAGQRADWKFGPDDVKKIWKKDQRWLDMAKEFIIPQFELPGEAEALETATAEVAADASDDGGEDGLPF